MPEQNDPELQLEVILKNNEIKNNAVNVHLDPKREYELLYKQDDKDEDIGNLYQNWNYNLTIHLVSNMKTATAENLCSYSATYVNFTVQDW
jgi:hypothetical protein